MKKKKKYDLYFIKEYRKHFYNYKDLYSWKIIKAQSIQESRLKPTAVSPVGAMGLMQIMPFTEKELAKKLNISQEGSAFIPELAIKMGVYYDYQLFNNWRSKRTLEDRYKLTFASYNAGLGNLLKAQKRCMLYAKEYNCAEHLRCNEYIFIEAFLYQITGHNSEETITYNKRIFKYYMQLIN